MQAMPNAESGALTGRKCTAIVVIKIQNRAKMILTELSKFGSLFIRLNAKLQYQNKGGYPLFGCL
jgi:hypothetical protein